MSLTSPLGLTRHLRRPEMRLDMVPWLNVLVLGWMLTLLNSSFIYAPGIVMNLASGEDTAPPSLNLPIVPGEALSGEPADAEVTILPAVKQGYLFIFEGRFYHSAMEHDALQVPGLQQGLAQARKKLRDRPPGARAILLIEADASVTEQTLLTLGALAKAAGFTSIVLAATEAPSADNTPLSSPPPPVVPEGTISVH
jgi:biopolymer transport protein ExbD